MLCYAMLCYAIQCCPILLLRLILVLLVVSDVEASQSLVARDTRLSYRIVCNIKRIRKYVIRCDYQKV
jgi:hypothetical protein